MEIISVLDMLKIGVGPSSSHTLGPWRAIELWLGELLGANALDRVVSVVVDLYGSLALTGIGHCTDQAICLALAGHDPETIPVDRIAAEIDEIRSSKMVRLAGRSLVSFDPSQDIRFHRDEQLPFHPNGMRFSARVDDTVLEATFYSIGGGFVVRNGEAMGAPDRKRPPYPCQRGAEVSAHCEASGLTLAAMVRANEETWLDRETLEKRLRAIWTVMRDSVHRGCHTSGILPGGLEVERRAAAVHRSLRGESSELERSDPEAWIRAIKSRDFGFKDVLKFVSCFALAVNEENAALGRVVTAPTNGAAGVIPAVLLYHVCFSEREVSESEIFDFLLIAGEIGSLFKKGATISAAMGGCQAEIGVSSSMAAAALTEVCGGSVGQALMAAEVAMEHHLGMICDPVQGFVQVPCIERNAMGAIKAINAAEMALVSDPRSARVSLDDVIRTMQETARDMSEKYKETSKGGLATNISVRLPEC